MNALIPDDVGPDDVGRDAVVPGEVGRGEVAVPGETGGERPVLVLAHVGRTAAVCAAEELVLGLAREGLHPRMLPEEAAALGAQARTVLTPIDPVDPLDSAELVVVVGGDGTILRAADVVRGSRVPLLGVNLGHVGFLAEAERDDLAATVRRIAERRYEVEERMTLDVRVRRRGRLHAQHWAVNEATVEKANRERMVDLLIEVDGRPLTSFGCDGVVLATPTGSTAYGFSAGGPVVWPEVEALLLVPISAHALFARPLVTAPTSTLVVQVLDHTEAGAVLWCDGRRAEVLEAGDRVEVARSAEPVRLARLSRGSFTDRLVAKFGLPVRGWRHAEDAGTGAGPVLRGSIGEGEGEGGLSGAGEKVAPRNGTTASGGGTGDGDGAVFGPGTVFPGSAGRFPGHTDRLPESTGRRHPLEPDTAAT